jgi:hypothetical protein
VKTHFRYPSIFPLKGPIFSQDQRSQNASRVLLQKRPWSHLSAFLAGRSQEEHLWVTD